MSDKKTFLINPGGARCGTTATYLSFKNHPVVNVPSREKEIKAFFDPDANLDKYLDKFSGGGSIYFESSPPYMGRGLTAFSNVLDKAIEVLGRNIYFLFNLRSLASRSFSHYWHEINKHHSLYGKYWKVKSSEDPERYRYNYKLGFFDAILSEPNKFLPDYMGMILLTGEKVGWENVGVMIQDDIEFGFNMLCDDILKIDVWDGIFVRNKGVRAPIFYNSGDVVFNDSERLGMVPEGKLLRIGHDSVELLSSDAYNINDIYEASQSWTRFVERSTVVEHMKEYLHGQAEKALLVPKDSILSNTHSLAEYLSLTADLSVQPQEFSSEKVRPLLF